MSNKSKRNGARPQPAKKGVSTTVVVKEKATRKAVPQTIPKSLVSQVCGLTDPFCEHAKGAKYPDSSNSRTLAWSFHTRATITSSAAGVGGFLFYPQFEYLSLTPYTSVTGNQVLLPLSTLNAGRIANTSRFRIVSAGFKLRNIVAPLNSSGMVFVRSIGVEKGAGINPFDGVSYSRNQTMDIPLQDCRDAAVICEHNSQMPQVFYDALVVTPSSDCITWLSAGFNPVTVFFSGVPINTPTLDVEYIIHYELTFDESSDMGLLATPPPPANALVTSATSLLTSTGLNIFTKSGEILSKHLAQRATSALARYLLPGGVVAGSAYAAIRNLD